jgi:RNA polymerase sigma factor (sigma-70 family)
MDLHANRSLIVAALARIPAGDCAALQTLYRLTSAKLFGVCLRILGERSEAEDVLQEAYVTVWRNAAYFDASRASPITWLIAITRNRAIDRLRATRQSRRMDPIDAAAEVADSAPSALWRVRKPARGCMAAWRDWRRMSVRRCAGPISTATPMRTWRRA